MYEAYVHGRPSPLHDIPVQYADFSYWQRQRLQPDVLEKMFSFWKHHLSGSDSDFALPTDRPRPSVQSHNGDEFSFFLSKELTEALYQLCRKYNVTLFALLFSAFNVLLHRYTGEKHIRVGVPVANRGTSEIEALIGYFVNVLVLHTDISGNPKFTTLLARTHEAMLDSQPHQEYPFELLVKKLNPVRDPSFNPLFQIMFVLHNVPFDSIWVTGLEIEPFPIESNLSKFDLTLHLTEDPNGLRAYLEYNVDLFDRSTIIRMADHFRVLLENIVAAPELRIGELRLLTPSEERQATSDWIADLGDCSSFIPSCRKDGLIHTLFEAQVQCVPAAIAVSSNSRTLTYAELNAKANQLAHYLRYKGISPETTVALCIGRLPEMVIGILGVLKAGGIYVPIDPKYPKDEIAYLLKDSGSVLLLTRKPLLSDLPALTIDIVCIDEDWEAIAEHSQVNPPTAINPNNTAYIIYTSGSTGKPKGVVVSHRKLLHSTLARFAYYKEPLEGFLLLSPFSFDSSVAGFYWTLSQGAKLCIPDDLTYADPTFLVEWIEKERITHLLCLPSFYNILLDQAEAPQLDSLRAVVVAGEACLSKVAERHYSRLPEAILYNEYGPTEGTVWCSVYKIPPEFSDDSIPIGRAISGVKIYLLDTYLNRVPVGIPGEIYIGGEGVAMGYLNQSALTAERFIPNSFDYPSGTRLYQTGDRARYREDGNMIFLGRDDRQIKIRGFRVELGQIETALLTHPAIEDAAVIDHEIPSGSKHLVAYVISRPGEHRTDADDLRAFLKNRLPEYMVPSSFVFLERFPFRPNGKLDRKALALMDVRDQWNNRYVAPRNHVEHTLAELWSSVLNIERIGIYDDFFALGGHSLLATQLLFKIRQLFNCNLSLLDLFQAPTIASQARSLVAGNVNNESSEVDAIDWKTESRLDESIRLGSRYRPIFTLKSALLTGATGFLGVFLLKELLQQTRMNIYCLVRAATPAQAVEKINRSLESYGLWDDAYASRIYPVCGDLAKPCLGIQMSQWQKLTGEVDAVYHNGALVNFVYPYSTLKSANVLGTQEVLRFACTAKVKPVHYISTLSVLEDSPSLDFKTIMEDDFPEDGSGLVGGYAQSKWVAEKIVRVAGFRGLPVSIYRPSTIVGDSCSGVWNTGDFLSNVIGACLLLRKAPEQELMFNTVPVDYVSRALVFLSGQPQSIGKTYHLTNPSSLSNDQLIDWACAVGILLERVDFNDWLAGLRDLVGNSSDHPFYSLVPMLDQVVLETTKNKDSSNRARVYDCKNVSAGLSGTDIICPPSDECLWSLYFHYLQKAYGEPPYLAV